MKKFGITPEEYDVQLEKQNYRCYICKGYNNDKALCVDHNHKTGKIRKLLCTKCNYVLGHANDDIIILEKMIEYLKEHSE